MRPIPTGRSLAIKFDSTLRALKTGGATPPDLIESRYSICKNLTLQNKSPMGLRSQARVSNLVINDAQKLNQTLNSTAPRPQSAGQGMQMRFLSSFVRHESCVP